MRLVVEPTTKPLSSELLIPNSKYHAHRALILASLAPGRSRIVGLTHARHVESTLEVLRGLGTRIDLDGNTFVVDGGPYKPRARVLSAGSSGSTLYFMAGLCALAATPVTLAGQRYLQRRPLGPLLAALQRVGIRISASGGCPPLHIECGRPRGGLVRIAGTLSQWISGLLLVAPFATAETVIEIDGTLNERPYIDLTIAMMARFGLEVFASADRLRYVVPPNQQARPATVRLPPDIGSAAFGLAIAALHPCDLLLRNLTPADGAGDHPEIAFLDIIRSMGLPMQEEPGMRAVRVRHDGERPRAVRVDCRETPDMLPILVALAAFAEGETVISNIDHVRLKESDRVAAMLQLNGMGARLRVSDSQLIIQGVDRLAGADLSSFNDHRVLMSLAIAATRATGRSRLTYPNAYRISYPEFLNAMNGVGARMECTS
ncbi:MAG TPA: 3-phosphoshikimate 1-carboxyvinyltransferase [Steroidobacteraceae bacterium]|nr:3-phosphoshikimate 1-carboxyvinyltransferase [Steroidobacteraceae bacterium]